MSTTTGVTRTRALRAGTITIRVSCPSPEVRAIVEAAYADLPDGDPLAAIDLALVPDGDRLTVEGADYTSPPQPVGLAIVDLISLVERAALDADPDHLHLHGAALALDGRGLLVRARSGVGKTTLATVLARRGWSYLSDEAIALEASPRRVRGFARPLVLDRGSIEVVPEVKREAVPLPAEPTAWVVPASRAGAEIATTADVAAIVCLERDDDQLTSDALVASMHPVDTVVELMGQSLDAERYGPGAVTRLAELAAGCTCARVTIGTTASTESVLAELVRSPVAPLDVRELVAGSTDAPWQPGQDARSVLIGDRVVVHETRQGAIVGLDDAASALWLALHGEPPSWWDPSTLDQLSTVRFLSELAAHGLVRPA